MIATIIVIALFLGAMIAKSARKKTDEIDKQIKKY